MSMAATECRSPANASYHQGMHLNAESLFVEIVREGKRVPNDELGEIVLTNLDATAVPFIRYNIQDVGALTSEPCRCGRGLPRLGHLEGRLTDMFVTPDGHWLTVHQFTAFFAKLPSVQAHQVIQRQLDDFVIRLVVDDRFGEAERQRVIETFQGYFGPHNRFTLEFLDEIPTTPAGKRRFFISEVIEGTGNELGAGAPESRR